MQIINLLSDQLPIFQYYPLGQEIGVGSDGQVFEILNDPNKVIKFCIIYDCYNQPIHKLYNDTKNSLDYIKRCQPCVCTRVYEHDLLIRSSRQTVNGSQDYLIHYYVMEKLYKTTADERKVFHSILSHEDRGIIKDYTEPIVRDMLQGMRRGLDFDIEKVILFYNNLINSPIRHPDIHVRNIMKNKQGEYRLIDFDNIKIGVKS